ncbi:hypothetical protein HRbin22_00010 [Candidatus Thermoflexus japonica]|uniref:Uncharacterized protein n=1 Tax=Candidatus Thermoflexus japonica TaxID=2035417 RepID=A0A2H5Y2Y1_9CHLR|nr:hypothetical protein HRbin22_00010 [Candidatus Thermoflexus japonica]
MAGLRRPEGSLRRRRPTLGVERLWRPISIGGSGRRPAHGMASNEFDLDRPSADGRPAPAERLFASAKAEARSAGWCRMNSTSRGLAADGRPAPAGRIFASAEADAGRGAPLEADFNRLERPMAGVDVSNEFDRGRPCGRWPAWMCRMNSTGRGLRPAAGLRRPEGSSRRHRPMQVAPRLERSISIGVSGRRGAREGWGWGSNEFDLERPPASGRPSPAGRIFASAEAEARSAGWCRMNSTSRGLAADGRRGCVE